MTTPQEWIELLSTEKPSDDVKLLLEREARAYLGTLPPGITVTTNELGDRFIPRRMAEQSLTGDIARAAVYKLLQALAKGEMADCCTKGEVNGQYMGKPKRPWIWFCPADDCCRTCGRPWPKDEITEKGV